MRTFLFEALARVNPDASRCEANIRLKPEHFRVDERLPFEPDEQGGQVMLLIEKTQTNTDYLAKQLAKFVGVPDVDIGYAGLKDRHAVTTQWFTVKVEGIEEPDWTAFNSEQWQIKSIHRHNKKLKRGVLIGNQFSLCLTELKGDKALWEHHLNAIKQFGVPNYFAEQRFGREGNNLNRVQDWFSGGRAPKKRQQKSLYLSAARSWLFNLVLSERIQQENWNHYLTGDVMQLAGSQATFLAEPDDKQIADRLNTFDIHPTGPMWGRGSSAVEVDCLALEQTVLADWQDWQTGLEKAGLKQERRALRLIPENFSWQFDDDSLQLSFFLRSGSYATAVLRELAIIHDVSERNSTDKSAFSTV